MNIPHTPNSESRRRYESCSVRGGADRDAPHWLPYVLLALANLFWAGNWVIGRALRESFAPATLSFLRWLVAALVLAPFAVSALCGKGEVVRRHLWLLLLLALTGGVLFQALVYLGLQTTTAVNAVLLNSSAPLFMLLCSWIIDREAASARQLIGVLISWVGIFIILGRGDAATLLRLEFHSGDGWILLAMPMWGVYSVLLKRLPPELRGTAFLCVLTAMTVLMLMPPVAAEMLLVPPKTPTSAGLVGVLYLGVFASVGAFMCWNRAVAQVGANVAGFSMPLLPAFGTVLAMVFLGEELRAFHLVGIATILAGVILATRPAAKRKF
jgi:drug/metabolite transporter (DMT)-like permease